MNRRIAAYGLIGALLVGLALAAIPFLASLSPNDRARASLTPIDVSELDVGEFKVMHLQNKRLYVVHPAHNQYTVLWVPTKNGVVALPDMHWWRPSMPCIDFGPDNKGGRLTTEPRFRCRDANSSLRPKEAWLWDESGSYAGPAEYPMDDIPKARFERAGSQLLIVPP